jgi:hypothetical protein
VAPWLQNFRQKAGAPAAPGASRLEPLGKLHKTIFRKMKEVYCTFLTAGSGQHSAFSHQ